MMDIYSLVPRHKFDNSNIELLKIVGIKEATPIMGELLEWLQDINWPVAKELMDVLPRFHFELVPHIKEVLSSNDDIWKCWTLCLLEKFPKETVILLADDIKRIVNKPTHGELEEETHVYAQEVIARFEL